MAPAIGYLIPECDLAGAYPYGVAYARWGTQGALGGGGDGASPPSDFHSKASVQCKRGLQDTSGASDFHGDESFDCDV
jgi:hypothetical protein